MSQSAWHDRRFRGGVTSYTSDNVGDWLMLFEASSSSAQGVATFTN